MTRININLLGLERKEALGKPSLPIDKGWMVAVLLIILSGSISLIGHTLVSDWKNKTEIKKAKLEQDIKKLDVQLKEVKDLETERNNLVTEEKILLYVTGETYKWSYALQEIRALMPLDLYVNDLKISAGGSFKLLGHTVDHKTVALFLSNLQNSQMVANAKLNFSKKESEEVTSFDIDCQLKM